VQSQTEAGTAKAHSYVLKPHVMRMKYPGGFCRTDQQLER
jgi:hypothetical protein